ncbi:MAG: hypothetical protein ABI779_10090 [Acidobacteriota bacterium]
MSNIGHRSTACRISPRLRPRSYHQLGTRDDYRRRIAELRPLIATFRGPLEHAGCGGSNGSISERTPEGTEYHIGGAVTEEGALAIVAAVNFVRDLCRLD